MPRFTKDSINANQDYLKSWDEYQLDFLNSKDFSADYRDRHALLLPVFVDIDDGIVKRGRITAPQVKTLREQAEKLIDKDSDWAFDSYLNFFGPIDGQQSGAPTTPLDFDINSRVYMLFHLPRKNWTFTEKVQFTVDNISKDKLDDAFEVVGTFDDGHGLLVHNKNWQPVIGRNGETSKSFWAKYNLHVSIHQTQDDMEMRTDIIIDPGWGGNDKPQGQGGG